MLFRRRHSAAQKKLSRAARAGAYATSARSFNVEPLEKRQLLTALINGTFDNGSTIFQWEQPNGDADIRISVTGNMTIEFIGAVYDPTQPSGVRLTDLADGVWLFSIYIVAADMDSTLSISGVTGTPQFMNPFADGPDLRTITAEDLLNPVGAAYIGAQTPSDFPDPANNIPLLVADQRRFGMRPSSAGELWAGIEAAPGVSIGRIFIGGTVTGLVDIPGHVETFYANNILTGDANGIPATSTTTLNKNFRIGGDIGNLLAGNTFGALTIITDGADDSGNIEVLEYKTGFKLDIGGRVGQIRAGDSFLGQAVVRNDSRINGTGLPQQEVETRGPTLTGSASYFDPQFFGNDIGIGGQTLTGIFNNNDTFDNAQFLGTARSTALKSREVIQLRGTLGLLDGPLADPVDMYAVNLLAGQTMEVELVNPDPTRGDFTAVLGVFDPDGRLIITQYSNTAGTRIGSTLKITADRPGGYRIAIGCNGDVNFNGALDAGESIGSLSPNTYDLRVRKIADIALGGLVAENHIGFMDSLDKSVEVLRGDLGEIRAGVVGSGTIFSEANPIYIPAGNLRAIEAFSMGVSEAELFVSSSGPDLLVRKGSVGLIRGTGPDLLSINDDTAIYPISSADLRLTSKNVAVGGDIQLVDSNGSLQGTLLANGGIGVIRAASVGTNPRPSEAVWQANVDRSGSDGVIDLIDVTGILNGPAISTGPNGNVRYMRAGTVFRDSFFGGGSPEATVYAPGVKARITDDSGTQVVLTPQPLQKRSPLVPGQPEFNDAPSLSVLTYPIRYSGGSVILNVTVTPVDDTIAPATNGGGGLLVEAGTRGPLGTAEISQVTISGNSSNTLEFDPFNRLYNVIPPPPNQTNPPTPNVTLDVTFRGAARIDLWELIAPAGTTFDSIVNGTGGEIVNITGAPDIILLEADTIGLAKRSVKTAVEGVTILDNSYPFNQQRTLINVGDLNSAVARRGIGNIVATNINSIRANSDRKNVAGEFEGINAPIVCRGADTSVLEGNIVSVQIGEGVLPSGSGLVGFAGLYATGAIDNVVGSGVGVDIRGDIVASNGNFLSQQVLDEAGNPVLDIFGQPIFEETPLYAIGNIRLNGGSIVEADILAVSDVDPTLAPLQAQEGNFSYAFIDLVDNFSEQVPDINSVRIDGIGGVIGSFFAASDIGLIQINGGFGVITSGFSVGGAGNFDGIVTDGYGVRDSSFNGGATLKQIVARGTGKRVATTSYSSSVRNSESNRFDPYTGQSFDGTNDLHAYLGTSARAPKRVGISDTGVIEDSDFVGGRDLTRIEAHRIIGRDVFAFDILGNNLGRIPYGDAAYPMRITFGNSIGDIVVRDVVDGLSLTGSGSMNSFTAGGDVMNTRMDFAGRVKSIHSGKALRGTTEINVEGPDGQLDSISTGRSLYATVNVAQDIITASVGTDLGSPWFGSSRNIRSLSVKGSILTGATVRARKTIFSLNVGGDLQAGATVRANNIASQTFGGEVIGDIVIA